jgi:hypothetical protein
MKKRNLTLPAIALFVFTLLLPTPASAAPAPATLHQAAAEIDTLVANYYRQHNFPVPPAAADAKFLRRTYLTVLGRIPTHDEASAFLTSPDPEKRRALVATLLDAPGYSSHMANWMFDLVRLKDRTDSTPLAPYRHWLRTAIDTNLPWDEITRRLLASNGSGWSHENAAIGYYIRDRGMPHDNLANSMRIFLGKRMECAQCHDDPFGDTERRDFYHLAAFTEGQQPLGAPLIDPILTSLRSDSEPQSQEYHIARMVRETITGLSLAGGGSGRITLPADYQYRDARPGDLLGARTPFGTTVRMSERQTHNDGREKLADWVITRTGHQFSAVIANRMWRRVMGQGLVEPIDDFAPIEDSHHPALFARLASLMVELKYDLKAFQHVLLLTRTYAFDTNPNPSTVHSGDDFHGRRLHRLSSEQIWDSLVTLAAGNPDTATRPPLDDTIRLHGRPVLAGRKTMTQLAAEIHAQPDERRLREYLQQLTRDIQETSTSHHDDSPPSMMHVATPAARRGLIRAADLPSPAPRNHLLATFGQSDREVVDASSREPNVGQVLALMNGFVQKEIIANPGSHLFRDIPPFQHPKEKIHRLTLSILARPPTDAELEWMLPEVQARGDTGLRNLAAALLMSSEFLFLQ